VAIRLRIDTELAGWGIHEVINEDVAKAFRVHASERGIDYRRCSMIVFGGSGPIHGCRIARKLRVPQVICPSGAGVMSAFGLLTSPVGFELVQSLRVSLADLTLDQFARIVGELDLRVRKQLEMTGDNRAQSTTRLRLDMRYVGQGYEVEVAVPGDDIPGSFEQLASLFLQAYAIVFGQSFSDKEVEVVAWKVEVQGPVPGGDAVYRLREGPQSALAALRGSRPGYFADHGYLESAVYNRYALLPGDAVDGPAMIEEAESTCVLAPGDRANVDSNLNLIIDIGGLQS
jgi:N-methylhydantoinase A